MSLVGPSLVSQAKRLISALIAGAVFPSCLPQQNPHSTAHHPSSLSLMSIPAENVHVASLSSFNSSRDDLSLLKNAINSAKSSNKPSEVILEPRTYRLNCSEGFFTYCIQIHDAKNLRLRGTPGKTRLLIATPRSGAIEISRSSNIEIVGLTVDYETPPFTQGRITAVYDSTFHVSLDAGYPRPSDAVLNEDIFRHGSGFGVGFVILPDLPVLRPSLLNYITFNRAPTLAHENEWVFQSEYKLQGLMLPGDRFAYGPRSSHALQVSQSSNITFSEVTIHTSPSIAFAIINVSGQLMFNSVTVALPPGSSRVLSTVADAIHLQNVSAQTVVQNSRFEAMGDDAFNSYSNGATVFLRPGLSANQLVLELPKGIAFQHGQKLQIVDPISKKPRSEKHAEYLIERIENEGSRIKLTLNRALSNVHEGDKAYNFSLSAPSLLMRNNQFEPFRGLLRVRSSAAQILENTFHDAENAKIYISMDRHWDEGPAVPPPTTCRNQVRQGQLIILGADLENLGPAPECGASTQPNFPPPSVPPSHGCTKPVNEAEYLSIYPDVARAGMNPFLHWVRHGKSEGRCPVIGPCKSVLNESEYLEVYNDVRQSGLNPHYHYSVYGESEGRCAITGKCSGMVSSEDYLKMYPDVKASGMDPQTHYRLHGAKEGRCKIRPTE